MLERLFTKENKFFTLFERHAQATQKAAKCMLEAVEDLSLKVEKAKCLQDLEHECDSITHETVDLLHSTFITPLDRDEILALISGMDDVVDNIDAAAHRLVLFEINEVPAEIIKQCHVLIDTQDQLALMVSLLRNMKNRDAILDACKEINRLENQGDQFHRSGIAALFHTYRDDPLMVIKLKELYEILEVAIDCIEDVANIAESIVLEHS